MAEAGEEDVRAGVPNSAESSHCFTLVYLRGDPVCEKSEAADDGNGSCADHACIDDCRYGDVGKDQG